MSSVCPSVCLSVCDVGGLWSHRLEILETNSTHRRRSSVNFGRQDIFARKLCMKKLTKCLNCTWYLPEKFKMPEFLWYLPEQLTKFPNFTWYLPENAGILHDNYPKNKLYFREFYWRRGTWGAPVSYAYDCTDIHLFPGEQGKIRGGPFGISASAGYLQKN